MVARGSSGGSPQCMPKSSAREHPSTTKQHPYSLRLRLRPRPVSTSLGPVGCAADGPGQVLSAAASVRGGAADSDSDASLSVSSGGGHANAFGCA